ncbi:hypothetical protein VB002_00515 [Campylobacter concisus]
MSDEKFIEVLSQRGLVNKDDDGFNYDLNTVFEDYIFYFNDILNIINSQNGIAIKKIYIDCDYEIKNFANFHLNQAWFGCRVYKHKSCDKQQKLYYK